MKLDNFERVKKITHNDLYELETGTYIEFTTDNEDYNKYTNQSGVAILYIEKGYFYMLQDFALGSRPDSYEVFKKYNVKGSWIVKTVSDYVNMYLLKKKEIDNNKEDDSKKYIDPFTFNFDEDDNLISEDTLVDAHFALIIDLSENLRGKFDNISSTNKRRSDNRLDALSLMSHDQIKSENIKRYFDKMSEIDFDLKNIKNIILRVIGGTRVLFLIKTIIPENTIDNIASDYYKLMKYMATKKEGENGASILKSMSDKIKSYTKEAFNYKSELNEIIDTFKGSDFIEDKTDNGLALLNKLEEFSLKIFNLMSKCEIKTLDDVELFLIKVKSLRNILSSNRNKFYPIYDIFLSHVLNRRNFSITISSNNYNGISDQVTLYDIFEQIDKLAIRVEKIFN